jgi:hypothetical protein
MNGMKGFTWRAPTPKPRIKSDFELPGARWRPRLGQDPRRLGGDRTQNHGGARTAAHGDALALELAIEQGGKMKAKRSNEALVPDKNSQLQKWLDVPSAKITPCALILPKNMDFDVWAPLGPKVARLKRFCAWALGDWLSYGEIVYGETYSQACDTTGLNPEYLMILKSVASRIEPHRRRPALSFSHHKAVASLEPREQDRLLDAAEKNQWTREAISAAVREFKGLVGERKNSHQAEADSRDEQGFDWQSGQQAEVEQSCSPTPDYDRMLEAIDRCYAVDPIADITDKALALKLYAEQAKNMEPEQKLIKIRLRAERRFKNYSRNNDLEAG